MSIHKIPAMVEIQKILVYRLLLATKLVVENEISKNFQSNKNHSSVPDQKIQKKHVKISSMLSKTVQNYSKNPKSSNFYQFVWSTCALMIQ